jgi:UDP-N-acetylglucosamine--N-acetylmuramyl-(pentapeptide) pyrophosphoryl-undecaprenol N-acetylglucosamine transferase
VLTNFAFYILHFEFYNMGKIKILVTGGGTGGHVFPAIAIADALKHRLPDAEFLFVGANGKMEMEKVPQAGYEIKGLTIAGFQRKLSLGNIIKNILFPFKLIGSMGKALWIISNYRPTFAVGTGGYASGPVLKICGWMGIPYFIQEANSLPGITNKILGAQAKKVFVSFENMEQYFEKSKIVISGNPIRNTISKGEKPKAESVVAFGLDSNNKTVFLTGGSLGANAINEGVIAGIEKLKEQKINVIWQCGKNYLDNCLSYQNDHIKVMDFVMNMNDAYNAADIIVSRAGGTISELAIIGKPTILLPSVNVAEDHQTKNVMALVDKNATVLIKDIDAKSDLVDTIISLLNDENRMSVLRKNIEQFAKPNASKEIAEEIIKEMGHWA